jgi:thiamine pyrophosphokinase
MTRKNRLIQRLEKPIFRGACVNLTKILCFLGTLLFLSHPMLAQKFLIVAHGPFDVDLVREYQKDRITIALDGAANEFYDWGLTPDLISGDMDSILEKVKLYFEKQAVQFFETHDQNYTDLEKSLKYCLNNYATDIVILCAFGGGRSDHTFHNAALLKRYYDQNVSITLVNFNESIRFLRDETITLSGPLGSALGLFGFPKAIATTQGLQWEMNDYPLELAIQESVANRFKTSLVTITVKGEALLVAPRTPVLKE